jgi:hypothetical protein
MTPRRSPVVLLVLFAAALLALTLFIATSAPTAHQLTRAFEPVREYVAHADRREPRAHDAGVRAARAGAGVATPWSKDPAARDALRRDIVRALEKRGIASAPVDHGGTQRPSTAPADEAPSTGPGLKNHLGGHDELHARLNGDFMPLADECIDQARERRPDLSGMVAIEVELLAERDIGAIVESAEAAPDNAVDDAELVECLQESLLSMSLPGDAVDGREQIMITRPTERNDDGRR